MEPSATAAQPCIALQNKYLDSSAPKPSHRPAETSKPQTDLKSMYASNAIDVSLLDHPIWHSLTTTHAHIALGTGLARRYPSEIGPLSALRELTPEAWAELASITPAGDIVALFLDEKPSPPIGWEIVRDGMLVQMLCPSVPDVPVTDHPLISLDP